MKQTNEKNFQIFTFVITQISRYLNNVQQYRREFQTTETIENYPDS